MKTLDIVEYVQTKGNLESDVNYLYFLTHTYDEQQRKIWVKAPYDYETFNVICAYIQFECAEFEQSFSIDQTDVLEVLKKYYDCTGNFSVVKEDKRKAKEINLYLNWEQFCGCAEKIQSIESLHREGMNELLYKFVEDFYQSHPEWRPLRN